MTEHTKYISVDKNELHPDRRYQPDCKPVEVRYKGKTARHKVVYIQGPSTVQFFPDNNFEPGQPPAHVYIETEATVVTLEGARYA